MVWVKPGQPIWKWMELLEWGWLGMQDRGVLSAWHCCLSHAWLLSSGD